MTEPDHLPAADPPAAPPQQAPEQSAEQSPALPPPVPGRRDPLPWLCALGFIVLAGAIAFVGWASTQREATPTAAVAALEARIAQLEQRPPRSPGPPPNLAPLQARVAALEHRATADLASLDTRVATLEQRAAPDFSALEARVATLEKRTADTGQLAARVDTLAARVDALSGRDQSAEDDLARRLSDDEARLTAQQQAIAAMTAAAEQATRAVRIDAAEAALAAGRPLGELPGAPRAVARFATASPPTEAALRRAFPRAEQAALAAPQPDGGSEPFFGRMLARAEDLVTVRQGDRVLLGNPAAGVLARARGALDAGDLAAAAAAVGSLSGPPAEAMAAWLADAKAVLAARAALAELAAHG